MNKPLIEFRTKPTISEFPPLNLYFCGKETCLPSHSFGPAIRPHFLLHYIVDGKGHYVANNKTYDLCSNDVFLIKPNQSTLYYADKKNPWSYIWLGFNGSDALRFTAECGFHDQNLVTSITRASEFEITLNRLLKAFQTNTINEYALTGHLYLCLSYLLNNSDYWDSTKKVNNYYHLAVEYIHTNYCYDIKVQDIARSIGIDRTYLYKQFINEIGISPQQYLILHRLQIASDLLKNSNLTIAEIALSCGFQDISAFHKHFKHHYGITPLNFRKKT